MKHAPKNPLRPMLIAAIAFCCSTTSLGAALAVFVAQQPAAKMAPAYHA